MLAYIAALLRNNEKRSQIRADDRALASDGFMLNLLSIMQLLSFKVHIITPPRSTVKAVTFVKVYEYCNYFYFFADRFPLNPCLNLLLQKKQKRELCKLSC